MGFEPIVRPAVIPNIRPAATPKSAAAGAADPTKGVFTIHGTAGKFIELPYSWSANISESNPQETKRRYDVARVYQKNDDGTVNRGTFVDVEVANRIWICPDSRSVMAGLPPR